MTKRQGRPTADLDSPENSMEKPVDKRPENAAGQQAEPSVDSAARKPARKADELLGRIIEIVRREGLASFSLDNLAPQLGTSSRMLVYHFGSKDELLGRIVYALRNDIVEAFDKRPAGTIIEAIDLWWQHYRENLHDMQFFFHLATRSFEEPDKFTDFSSTAVDLWASYFHRSMQSVTKSDEEAHALARLVLATVRGLMVDLLITGDVQHVEESLAEFKSLLRERLRLV